MTRRFRHKAGVPAGLPRPPLLRQRRARRGCLPSAAHLCAVRARVRAVGAGGELRRLQRRRRPRRPPLPGARPEHRHPDQPARGGARAGGITLLKGDCMKSQPVRQERNAYTTAFLRCVGLLQALSTAAARSGAFAVAPLRRGASGAVFIFSACISTCLKE